MYTRLLVFGCKLIMKVLRIAGKNGSALPGLIMERLHPSFLSKTLSPVGEKIILVTGTNGKTTTTKMLTAALRGVGARVVTNGTGSNMTRGLMAALVDDMTYFGGLKSTDWFVFEMDEAYAPIFTKDISPKMLVALNVLRDQLDRYGEIDATARLIEQAARPADILVYNQLDPLLSSAADRLRDDGLRVVSFGVDSSLSSLVKNEQTLHGSSGFTRADLDADINLITAKDKASLQQIGIKKAGKSYSFSVPVKGFHNALNATAVFAALTCLDDLKAELAMNTLEDMPTPFGRGELLKIGGKNITVALVKNPSGFMSNLETFVKQAKPQAVLFVVNDRVADGRDVSWLWDVEFSPFLDRKVKLFTSGIRGYDMALRLKQENFDADITTNVIKSIQEVMKSEYENVVIVPTYTALFEVRDALSKYGKVPRIW